MLGATGKEGVARMDRDKTKLTSESLAHLEEREMQGYGWKPKKQARLDEYASLLRQEGFSVKPYSSGAAAIEPVKFQAYPVEVAVILRIEREALLQLYPAIKKVVDSTVLWRGDYRCPNCLSTDIEKAGDRLKCKRCGEKFDAAGAHRELYALFTVAGFKNKEQVDAFLNGLEWHAPPGVRVVARGAVPLPPHSSVLAVYEWVRPPDPKSPFRLGVYQASPSILDDFIKDLEAQQKHLENCLKAYDGLGFSFVPVRLATKGGHYLQWGKYQSQRPSKEDVDKWLAEYKLFNVSIVCGKVSNVFVIDFDKKELYDEWLASLPEDLRLEVARKCMVTETGKGIHVYVRPEDPSLIPAPQTKLGGLDIDIRGEGSLALAPPSLHPSGKPYRLLSPLRLEPMPRDRVIQLLNTLPKSGQLEKMLEKVAGTGSAEEQKQQQKKEAPARHADAPSITAVQTQQRAVEKALKAPGLRGLSEERVRKIVELLKPYYVSDHRHMLLQALAGEAARKRVSPATVASIVKYLHDETDDRDSLRQRLGTVTYTYEKLGLTVDPLEIKAVTGVEPPMPSEAVLRKAEKEGARVTGAPSLKAIIAKLAGEEEAELVVKKLKQLLGRPAKRIVLEEVVTTSKDGLKQLIIKDSLVIYDNGDKFKVYRVKQLASGISKSLFAVLPEIVRFEDTSTGNTFYIARENDRVIAIAGSINDLLPALVNQGYIVAPSISSIAVQQLIDKIKVKERGELSPGFGEKGFVDPYGIGFDLTDYGVEGLISARDWIKKYYPESNRAAALANVAILVAKLLSPAARKRNHTFIDTIIWNYGRGGEGKTTLAAYTMLPLLGVNPDDERLIVFMRGAVETTAQMAFLIAVNRLPLILDEQTMRNLERNADIMLSAAVGHGVVKIHAPRYGYTGEVKFKNQRGLIVFTNVPFSQWLRKVRAHATDYAFARRFIEIQWENEAVSKEAFADLPRVKPILGAVERVWLERREELSQSRDAIDLARRLIKALSEAYGADLSDYLAALDEVEARWLGALSQIKATDVDLLRERAYEIARQQLGASQLTAARVVESMLSNPDYYGIKLYPPKRVKDKEEELAELNKVKVELMAMQGDDAQRLAKLLEDLETRGATRVVIRARSQLVPGEPREFMGARVSTYTFKQGDKSEVVNGYSIKVKQLLEIFGIIKEVEEIDDTNKQQSSNSTNAE
jgi:ribosomal protein L37AE/L43A